MIDGATYTLAGVRKPPRNEPAGGGGRRRRGLGYGDLADAEGVRERARCAAARAITRQAGNSSWDWRLQACVDGRTAQLGERDGNRLRTSRRRDRGGVVAIRWSRS